ncbi:hypothetical protein [Chamaesiphon sp. GL140_3_metabinner_50]|uniref:hypothetical protein n=1 Tax=Chamaesiphon sp. GL140_3_metabinner_50 TaxID=2970812 RepID=UPI0025EE1C3C|nr:hypothetical protein [Chamaesiphon sp. GL140_3_metabinner_50]
MIVYVATVTISLQHRIQLVLFDRICMYHPKRSSVENRSSAQQRQRSSVSQGSAPKSQVAGFNQTQPRQPVRKLTPNSAPAWLKSLLTMQRGSLIIFCTLLGSIALVYGYTARTQDLWKTQHKQLKRFQTQEQQQALMNEHLKQQLAETAETKSSGLVHPTPDRIVFIPSATPRPNKSLPTPQQQAKSKLPVGY